MRHPLLCLALALPPATPDEPAELRVMSFNVRYGTAGDDADAWEHRRDLLVETIAAFGPDLLGMQETLGFQRDFLTERLAGHVVLAAGRTAPAASGADGLRPQESPPLAPDLFSLDRFADGSGRSITAHDWATDHATGPPAALPLGTLKPDHAVVVVSSPVRDFPAPTGSAPSRPSRGPRSIAWSPNWSPATCSCCTSRCSGASCRGATDQGADAPRRRGRQALPPLRARYRDSTGRLRHRRQCGRNISAAEAAARGWTSEPDPVKHRYTLLLPDGRRHRRELLERLLLENRPYPRPPSTANGALA